MIIFYGDKNLFLFGNCWRKINVFVEDIIVSLLGNFNYFRDLFKFYDVLEVN